MVQSPQGGRSTAVAPEEGNPTNYRPRHSHFHLFSSMCCFYTSVFHQNPHTLLQLRRIPGLAKVSFQQVFSFIFVGGFSLFLMKGVMHCVRCKILCDKRGFGLVFLLAIDPLLCSLWPSVCQVTNMTESHSLFIGYCCVFSCPFISCCLHLVTYDMQHEKTETAQHGKQT